MAQDSPTHPPSPAPCYLKMTLELPEGTPEEVVDEVCFELMTNGALGTVVETERTVQCFVADDPSCESDSGAAAGLNDNFHHAVSLQQESLQQESLQQESLQQESTVSRLRSCAEGLGCTVVSIERAPIYGGTAQGWTAQCPELWAPIRAGAVQIEPVESAEAGPASSQTTIRIIPGLGFGTGHHQTTRMIVSALGSLWATHSLQPAHALDVGTGSGLLAITIARLFGSPVEGIDNDATALINARDNVALNGVAEQVNLSTIPLHDLHGQYDLIVANIYGEVLCAMVEDLTRLATPNALLLLSGITELVKQQVIDTYTRPPAGASTPGWQLIQSESVDGWSCLHLTRLSTAL